MLEPLSRGFVTGLHLYCFTSYWEVQTRRGAGGANWGSGFTTCKTLSYKWNAHLIHNCIFMGHRKALYSYFPIFSPLPLPVSAVAKFNIPTPVNNMWLCMRVACGRGQIAGALSCPASFLRKEPRCSLLCWSLPLATTRFPFHEDLLTSAGSRLAVNLT